MTSLHYFQLCFTCFLRELCWFNMNGVIKDLSYTENKVMIIGQIEL